MLKESRALLITDELHVVPVHHLFLRTVAELTDYMCINRLDMLVHHALAEARRPEWYRLLQGVLQVRVEPADGARMTLSNGFLSLHLQQRQLI